MPSAALEAVSRYAEGAVRREEGILQSLYRSMVDDTRRREEVAVEAARRKDEILSTHRAAIQTHAHQQREIESKIRESELNLSRIPEIVEEELQQFLRDAKIAEPTKFKDVRLIRAFYLGLISFDRTESARPDSLEYEEQKKRIRSRDNYRCVCCLRGFAQGELHVHHVLPLSRCGTNADSNLVTLCHPCHNKQHPDFQVTRSFPIKRRAPTSRFVAVDIETTGLSNEDSIIEIAAVRFVGCQVEEVFCSLVRSKRPVSATVTRITGITQSMIAEAPHPEIVIREFVEFISNHRLIFHNASFDMRFIGKYLEYFNYPIPTRILDTLPLARRKLPDLSSHRLAVLVEHLGLPVTRSHRAQDDSLATGRLYLALREIASPRARKKRKRSSGEHTNFKGNVAVPEQVPLGYPSEQEIHAHLQSILREEPPRQKSQSTQSSNPSIKNISELEANAPSSESQSTRHAHARPKYADPEIATIVRCPRCGQQLRVPAGKLLDIICRSCEHTFRTHTV